ncbi:MAG: hypothetical protein ACPHRI_02190, partial [Flavobacteriaceae bacterium]
MDTSTKTWTYLFNTAVYCWTPDTFFANQNQQHSSTIRPLPDHLIAKRDSLLAHLQNNDTIYPFNPNRLSSWLAYRLELPKSIVDSIQSRV